MDHNTGIGPDENVSRSNPAIQPFNRNGVLEAKRGQTQHHNLFGLTIN